MSNIIHRLFNACFFLFVLRNNDNTVHRLKNFLKSRHHTTILHLYC